MNEYIRREDVQIVLFDMCPFCRKRAEAILEARTGKAVRARPTVEELIVQVAQEYKLTAAELISPNNSPLCVVPRRVVAKLAREFRYSYPEIGKAMHRHHTTVMNLVKDGGYAIEQATKQAIVRIAQARGNGSGAHL